MKKFYIGLIAFLGLFLVVDLLVGCISQQLMSITKGGDTRLHRYINDEMTEDVLFMGSSRCMHHYIPSIINDSLSVRSYNCGTDGMGIPFMYARYLMITSRYKPQIIFYDVYPAWDIYDEEKYPNSRNLRWLKPYYDRDSIPEVFEQIDPTYKYKMWLKMFRYNGFFSDLVIDFFKPSSQYKDGYAPLYGEIGEDYKLKERSTQEETMVDSIKMVFWKKFIKKTKEDSVSLVLIYSPMWGQKGDKDFEPISKLAAEYNIPIINHYTDTTYINHQDLFSEPYHLNKKGSIYYSNNITRELKLFVKNRNN